MWCLQQYHKHRGKWDHHCVGMTCMILQRRKFSSELVILLFFLKNNVGAEKKIVFFCFCQSRRAVQQVYMWMCTERTILTSPTWLRGVVLVRHTPFANPSLTLHPSSFQFPFSLQLPSFFFLHPFIFTLTSLFFILRPFIFPSSFNFLHLFILLHPPRPFVIPSSFILHSIVVA